VLRRLLFLAAGYVASLAGIIGALAVLTRLQFPLDGGWIYLPLAVQGGAFCGLDQTCGCGPQNACDGMGGLCHYLRSRDFFADADACFCGLLRLVTQPARALTA